MRMRAVRVLPSVSLFVAAAWSVVSGIGVSGASAIPTPSDGQVAFVVNSSTPEIGITDVYGTHSSVINVAAAGGVSHPVLAPNRTKIAFDSNCTLYTVNTDGSDLAALPNDTGACEDRPAWSPNGGRLAFDAYSQTNLGLWISGADGSNQVEIAPDGASPTWSPSGNRVAFVSVSDHDALATVSAAGGPVTTLVSLPPLICCTGSYLTSPAWSPDGNTIAYVEGFDVGGLPGGGALGLVRADGANDRVVGGLSPSENGSLGISWCPNGRCLLSAFGPTNNSGSDTMLDVLDTNGKVFSSITVDGSDASFVGVQGPTPSSPPPPPTTGAASTATGRGFWAAGSDGGILTYGDAQFYGSMGGRSLNKPVVGMASTSNSAGYWEVASDGGIFSFGDAAFLGSMGGSALNEPVVGMAADPVTGGYWEVASDGGIFSFDAPFFGSTGSMRLNQPVVGMATTPDGLGYWLVAADGGIFAYGDAVFEGSMGGKPLNAPVTSMAATPSGGYWLAAADGGVFSFGSATFQGSMGSALLAQPVISFVPSNQTDGYREITSGGGMFNFSAPLG